MNKNAAMSHGFSLIELMIVISMLAIVLTVALPSMRSLLTDFSKERGFNKVISQQVESSIAMARRLGTNVRVCAGDCSVPTEWANGVVTETIVAEPATPTVLLLTKLDLSSFISVTAKQGGDVTAFTISRDGLLNATVTFCVKPLDGSAEYFFRVLRTGQIQTVATCS